MIGIFLALGAAFSWTYACYLWRKQTNYFSPVQINLYKNLIAFSIFSPIIFTISLKDNIKEIAILFVSGVIGIAIGDSFYITALKKLGTRRTLTVEAFSPLIATTLGSFILNELPPAQVWIGALLVTLSLIGVAFQRTKKDSYNFIEIKRDGFAFAFASILCAVLAAILSRLVLINSDLNPFQSTEIRLFGSIVLLIPFCRIDLFEKIKGLSLENKNKIFYATFLGTNLGILLQQYVFQLLPIGLGWTLLSTSPAFSLFFVESEGETLNWTSLFLTILTISGVTIALTN